MSKIVLIRWITAYRNSGCCTLVFILAFHLSGCGSGGDLEPRHAVINLVRIRTLPDGDVTETEHEFVSRNAAIWNLPHFTPEWKDAWAVYIPLVGRPTYYVSIVFKSPGPDPAQLAEGDGPGYVAAVDVPEREHGGDSPFDGVVHITEHVGATWSGHATVGVDVEVMSFAQQAPTGETIRIESVTFHSLPVE